MNINRYGGWLSATQCGLRFTEVYSQNAIFVTIKGAKRFVEPLVIPHLLQETDQLVQMGEEVSSLWRRH